MVFLQSLADQVTTSHPAQTLHISIDIRPSDQLAFVHACMHAHARTHVNISTGQSLGMVQRSQAGHMQPALNC